MISFLKNFSSQIVRNFRSVYTKFMQNQSETNQYIQEFYCYWYCNIIPLRDWILCAPHNST